MELENKQKGLWKLITDIYFVSASLFKVMIPTIIIVKIAEILGFV